MSIELIGGELPGAGKFEQIAGLTPAEVREDVIERALKTLRADAERGEGRLLRSDIDRTYVRRGLSIPECSRVEISLRSAGVRILEEEDDGPAENPSQTKKKNNFLTEFEERELARKIRLARLVFADTSNTDEAFKRRVLNDAAVARARFVKTNIWWVRKLAGRKRGLRHIAIEDVFQDGMIGLLRATETYDPDLGFRFKTYATWWIEQNMHRSIDDTNRIIRLPVHLQESIRKLRRKQYKLTFELGREPTLDELANELGADKERLAKLLWRIHATDCVDADAPIIEDFTPISFKADESESAFDIVARQQLREEMTNVLARLSPREERVLRLRFGLDGKGDLTLEAVGQIYGVTRERIRQIEAKALMKLKHPSRSRRLRSFLDNEA